MPDVLGLAFRWFDRPHMRMPQWRHRLFNRHLVRWSPPKIQACRQARHAGSITANTRDGPGSSATALSQTPRAADSTTAHGRLRLIHFGNVLSLRIWTVTVWDCSSLHDGPHATECLSRYC
ncbi:putative trans-sialidase [Trypanosoma cruzi]|nr:putative trans-sialidase [Trypanosoma cruzi]